MIVEKRMEAKQAHWFTVHRIILGDMILNWFLGVVLLVLPEEVDRVIGQAQIMPSALYRIIGVCFALFAAWQTWIVRREHIGAPGLIAAALLALIPLVMLTVALVFMRLAAPV
jgi:hypothetical protein